ncbi:hypothetical protein [Streptomyces sp. NPDC002403]
MSGALWQITAFVSRALNFIAFSCSAGSLSAMTPRLLKPSHWEEADERLDPVGRLGRRAPQRGVGEVSQHSVESDLSSSSAFALGDGDDRQERHRHRNADLTGCRPSQRGDVDQPFQQLVERGLTVFDSGAPASMR